MPVSTLRHTLHRTMRRQLSGSSMMVNNNLFMWFMSVTPVAGGCPGWSVVDDCLMQFFDEDIKERRSVIFEFVPRFDVLAV